MLRFQPTVLGMLMKKLMLLMMVLISFNVVAKEKDCEKSADKMGAVRSSCLFEQSNIPVQSAYNDLIKALKGNNEAIEWIKKAQADWELFRDDTCMYVSRTEKGTTGETDIFLACQIGFNEARVKMLKQYQKQAGKKDHE
jgi:uncharacterized protein YecT (DUF1311 family)